MPPTLVTDVHDVEFTVPSVLKLPVPFAFPKALCSLTILLIMLPLPIPLLAITEAALFIPIFHVPPEPLEWLYNGPFVVLGERYTINCEDV